MFTISPVQAMWSGAAARISAARASAAALRWRLRRFRFHDSAPMIRFGRKSPKAAPGGSGPR
jgi:hypothetical protein